jgi:hypothetical protein
LIFKGLNMANDDQPTKKEQESGKQDGGSFPDPNTQTLKRSDPPGDLKKAKQ